MLLVVAATERELAPVEGARTLVCGIGPVEAAAATARALAEERPTAVLHVGIAGAHALEPLTLVLGSEAVYCDATGDLVPARATPDPSLLGRLRAAEPPAGGRERRGRRRARRRRPGWARWGPGRPASTAAASGRRCPSASR